MSHKILFDLVNTQPSISGKRHGGGIYGEIVFRKLVEKGADLVAYYDSQRWLNPDIADIIDRSGIKLLDINKCTLRQVAEESGADILYTCLPGKYHLASGIKVLGTLHGLRHLEMPYDDDMTLYPNISRSHRLKYLIRNIMPSLVTWFNRRKQYNFLLSHAVDFVVVSNFTLHSVRSFYPCFAERNIKVFYSPSTTLDIPIPEGPAAAYPYFLMVSGNRWEKNTIRAIRAFEKLFDEGKLDGIKVHITGLKSLDMLRYNYRHPERFVAMGYVDDDELQRQYRDCYAFVYPSLNEGFGYPPVEAMRFGAPIAASNACSIPEVCGDAALYFNPTDVEEMSRQIEMLTDPSVRGRLHDAALARYDYITERQTRDLNLFADYIMNF